MVPRITPQGRINTVHCYPKARNINKSALAWETGLIWQKMINIQGLVSIILPFVQQKDSCNFLYNVGLVNRKGMIVLMWIVLALRTTLQTHSAYEASLIGNCDLVLNQFTLIISSFFEGKTYF